MRVSNSQTNKKVNKTWEIPACYNEDFALDIKDHPNYTRLQKKRLSIFIRQFVTIHIM